MSKSDAEQNAVWLDQLREAGRSEETLAKVASVLGLDAEIRAQQYEAARKALECEQRERERAAMGEGDYHLSYTKSVEDKLVAERAKTAALRALLEECESFFSRRADLPFVVRSMLERIRKELGK